MKRFWILPLLISVGGCVTQKPEASQNPSTSQILSDLDTRGRRQEEEIKILNQQVAELRGEYVLQAGDTLKKVANRFGLTLEEITQLNPDVQPARLRVGQRLHVKKEPISVRSYSP